MAGAHVLFLIIALAGFTAAPPHARAAERLPLFDAHVHYNAPAWRVFDPAYVRELFDRHGVTGALVSSVPDDGTLMLHRADPKRFVPELSPYHGEVNARNWSRQHGVVDYLKGRLARSRYAGIGEIHIYKVDRVSWEVIAQVAALARENGLFLHVHSGAEAIERIFALEKDLTIIWAHAGFHETPETVSAMLDKYGRLHAELSLRAPNIMPEGAPDILPGWKALFGLHPDRIVVGTDTYMNISWAEYGELASAHRRWLGRLPRETAEKIAHGNARRLFRDFLGE